MAVINKKQGFLPHKTIQQLFVLAALTTLLGLQLFLFSQDDDDTYLHGITPSTTLSNQQESYRIEDPLTCLTQECLNDNARRVARIYPTKPIKKWCSQSSGPPWQSLVLVKVPKAASSTAAGVALRIHNYTGCAVQYHHREGHEYANKSSSRSFFFAPLREPTARALSHAFFFTISPLNITPTDKAVIRTLHIKRAGPPQMGKGGYQFNYISPVRIAPHFVWSSNHPENVVQPERTMQLVQSVMDFYDLFLLVERMDESLTLLSILTNLPLTRVLAVSAKVSGNYVLSRYGKHKGQCRHQSKYFASPAVRQHVESRPWLAMNYADEILHRAANFSLDLTIEHIGRDRFRRSLREFQNLAENARRYCKERIGTGCTDDGKPVQPIEPCYERDFGCGYQCIDEMLAQIAGSNLSIS